MPPLHRQDFLRTTAATGGLIEAIRRSLGRPVRSFNSDSVNPVRLWASFFASRPKRCRGVAWKSCCDTFFSTAWWPNSSVAPWMWPALNPPPANPGHSGTNRSTFRRTYGSRSRRRAGPDTSPSRRTAHMAIPAPPAGHGAARSRYAHRLRPAPPRPDGSGE